MTFTFLITFHRLLVFAQEAGKPILGKIGTGESEAQADVNNWIGALAKMRIIMDLWIGVSIGLLWQSAPGGLLGFVAGTGFGMNEVIDSDSCGLAGWGEDAKETLRQSVRQWSKAVSSA